MATLPKRSTERRRRNKSDTEVVDITPEVEAKAIEPMMQPDEDWHPTARMQWDAAIESAGRIFFEQTDWSVLYMLCEQLSLELDEKVIGTIQQGPNAGELIYGQQPIIGAKLNVIMSTFTELLFTEGGRRRLKIELERGAAVASGEVKPGDVVQLRKSRLSS